MNVLLTSATINGIKNINNKIEISFTNKHTNENDFSTTHIKAIYGPNGAGKSGIIKAFDLYSRIVKSFIRVDDESFKNEFINYLNKNSNTFSISLSFSFNLFPGIIFTHSLDVSINEFGFPFISFEKLTQKNKRNEENIIFQIEDGKFISTSLNNDFRDNFGEILLKSSSLISLVMKYHFKQKTLKFMEPFFLIYYACLNMKVYYGEDADNYFNIINNATLNTVEDIKEYIQTSLNINNKTAFNKHSFAVININDLVAFKKDIAGLTKFIKIMKPDLKKITTIEKINDKFVYVNLLFNYKNNYSIDYDFESAGIKKMCKLYFAFKDLENGIITFIDEIDANIHDVYLEKIIEYFIEYSNGQLIITTHNARLMQEIKTLKKSIDFIALNNKYISWINNANNNPESNYLNGLIEFIPFNVESYEFGTVFKSGGNE